MHYTYVLPSENYGHFYTGTTGDLQKRLDQHAGGRVRSTAYRRPLKLLYYEACLKPEDAYRRERFLKIGKGGRYLRNRLASSLSELWENQSRSTVLERH